MKKNFYRAFEDKYRGSRELITGRLQFYRPFIEPLAKEFGRVPAIDLGCGRGEWLEVMLSAGFDSRGIDLDEGMLQSCVDLGLPAEKGEAIAHLRGLPSKSQAIVSAFHVVEHIPFDALEELVSEAKRVLLPGGLLILETPNPENIMVATCSFYLDPTHQRPIPPNLLSFVAEHVGFERVKVIRLQESKELAAKTDLLLEDVLGGVSPDYSVVALKKGKKSIMSALDQVFSQDYGLTLSGLSASYDAHMKGKAGEERLKLMQERFEAEKAALDSRLSTLASDHEALHQANHGHWQLAESLKQELAAKEQTWSEERSTLASRIEEVAGEAAVARAQSESLRQELAANEQAWSEERSSLDARLSTLVTEHEALHQANHGHWQLAESLKQELAAKEQAWSEERSTLDARLSTLVAERNALLASTCWRITAPIRWMRGGVRIPWPAPNEPLDDFFLKHAALYIRRRPHLKERALQFLFRNPKWHARVLPVLQGIKASTASPIAFQAIPQPLQLPQPVPQPASLHEISPLQESVAPVTAAPSAPLDPPIDLASLTPHARRIYADLKKAIEKKKGEVRA